MFNTAEEYMKKFEELKAERDEHLAIIEDIENNMKVLEKEFEAFKNTSEQDKQIKEAAIQLRKIYESYVDAGFSTVEAFRLVSTMLMSMSSSNLSEDICMALNGGF